MCLFEYYTKKQNRAGPRANFPNSVLCHYPSLFFRYQWSLDKVTLSDGRGKTLSFCKELAGGQFLPSGIPITFKFKNGDCVMKSALPAQAYGFLENKKVRILSNSCSRLQLRSYNY